MRWQLLQELQLRRQLCSAAKKTPAIQAVTHVCCANQSLLSYKLSVRQTLRGWFDDATTSASWIEYDGHLKQDQCIDDSTFNQTPSLEARATGDAVCFKIYVSDPEGENRCCTVRQKVSLPHLLTQPTLLVSKPKKDHGQQRSHAEPENATLLGPAVHADNSGTERLRGSSSIWSWPSFRQATPA